jgi:hypothetical protein
MPANSETTRPRLAMRRQMMANAEARSGNCSRMSDMSPSPVCAPRRADISCTTTSATVTSTIRNSVE